MQGLWLDTGAAKSQQLIIRLKDPARLLQGKLSSSVVVVPFADFTNNAPPMRFCSRLTCELTAGWLNPSRSPAFDRLPVSEIATTVPRSRWVC